MQLSRLLTAPRIIWRDLIMRLADATLGFDDILAAYFFTDTAYQYTWSKIEVHQTLLKDKVRMKAFEDAIKETVKPQDRVLDVGTGTGILALLAAKAGAQAVIGVDSADVIDVAVKTAKKNGIRNVQFIRADIRDLSIQKVDLIVCELIGLHITDEGLTYKVRNAMRLLKDGGKVMPEKLDVYLVPVESKDVGLGFWGDIHGIDYSEVASFPHEIRNYDMSEARYLSAPKKIFTIDLTGKTKDPLRFEGRFNIEADGVFHGCVMYWEAKLSKNVTLSTDPKKPLTHWKQIFLPHERRMPVKKGDSLKANVHAVLRDTKWRWNYLLG
jgi:type I protein arginine methyltransferase